MWPCTHFFKSDNIDGGVLVSIILPLQEIDTYTQDERYTSKNKSQAQALQGYALHPGMAEFSFYRISACISWYYRCVRDSAYAI